MNMNRALLLISLSGWLASCAPAPKPENAWWKSLSGQESQTDDDEFSCRGTRAGNELDHLAKCWPQGVPPLVPAEVRGLESLSHAQRECMLEGLPALVAQGEERAQCHQGLATVLARRLFQYGWRKAEVTPQEDTSSGSPAVRGRLAVQLGKRYRIGKLFVATDVNPKVSPKRILKQAEKGIPKRRWCTQAALDEIYTRVFDMAHFQSVHVAFGTPDDEQALVPVVIDVKE
jgi:translocation and assembly module TamA